jgi:hypothetical protein
VPVTEFAQPAVDVAAPVIAPVTELTQPVLDIAAPVIVPVTELTQPVLETIAPILDPVIAPVPGLTEPVIDALAPVAGPDTLAPITGPASPAAAGAVVTEPLAKPLTETVAPLGAPAIAPPVVAAVASAAPASTPASVMATAERIAGPATVRVLSGAEMSTSAASPIVPALPALGTGPSPADIFGLPSAERSSFGSMSPSDETAASQRHGSGQSPAPAGPRRTGPLSGPAGGGSGGASGPSGGDGAPTAAFFDPATAPAASTLGAATAVERRITWWYPEVVVSPG